jgi:aryl-alcohol dehydrogenase-like predicted oxidoreductase
MRYALLDGTGLVVSRLAFGAMTLGEGPLVAGVHNRIGEREAQALVGSALDAGINLFDTADSYMNGESERLLGQALGARRSEVVIATQVGFRAGLGLGDCGLSARHVLRACEASLKRLDTEWIELYQLHIPDPLTPLDETLRALEQLVRDGKVRHVGVSNFPAWRVAEMATLLKARGGPRLVSAQMHYALSCRDLEHEFVPMAEAHGLGLLVWGPLAGGFLSGKYPRQGPGPEGARRNSFAFPPVDAERGHTLVDALQTIAHGHGATPAQVALAWLLDKPYVTSVLMGASSPAQWASNLLATELELGADDLRVLDALTRPPPQYPGWMLGMGWDARVRRALEG